MSYKIITFLQLLFVTVLQRIFKYIYIGHSYNHTKKEQKLIAAASIYLTLTESVEKQTLNWHAVRKIVVSHCEVLILYLARNVLIG